MSRLSISVLVIFQGLLWWRIENVAGEVKKIDRDQIKHADLHFRETLDTASIQTAARAKADAALENGYRAEEKLYRLDETADELKKMLASQKSKVEALERDIDRDVMPDLKKWSAYMRNYEQADRELQDRDPRHYMNRLMGIKKLPWE